MSRGSCPAPGIRAVNFRAGSSVPSGQYPETDACGTESESLPLLYRVLVVANNKKRHRDTRSQSRRFEFPAFSQWELKKRISRKPTRFFQSAVKSLRVYDRIDGRNMEVLFAAFAGIINLALDWDGTEGVLPGLTQLQGLRRLRSALRPLFGASERCDFTHALFLNLTHLSVSDKWGSLGHLAPRFWEGLKDAPRLTHIAFDELPLHDQVVDILTAERLECIIFWVYGCQEESRQDDIRIVHIQRHPAQYWVGWNFGALPQDERWKGDVRDEWHLAEQFIAAKRSGTIEGALIPNSFDLRFQLNQQRTSLAKTYLRLGHHALVVEI
ncbi:hypothetical protein DFH06DRAFT_1130982 [Mycena polygramma]|nr:hypothetical protein DFH06DRAFT_1130982 [Mycena polygramma]